MPLWRETFKSPRIGKLDARVSFFIFPVFTPFFRLETIALLALSLITLYVVEIRYGMSFPSAVRYVRSKMAGKVRRPNSRISAPIDIHAADRAYLASEKSAADEISGNFIAKGMKLFGLDTSSRTKRKANQR